MLRWLWRPAPAPTVLVDGGCYTLGGFPDDGETFAYHARRGVLVSLTAPDDELLVDGERIVSPCCGAVVALVARLRQHHGTPK